MGKVGQADGVEWDGMTTLSVLMSRVSFLLACFLNTQILQRKTAFSEIYQWATDNPALTLNLRNRTQ